MGGLQLAFSKETASFWPEPPVGLRDAFEWPCPSGLWENPSEEHTLQNKLNNQAVKGRNQGLSDQSAWTVHPGL